MPGPIDLRACVDSMESSHESSTGIEALRRPAPPTRPHGEPDEILEIDEN